MPEEFALCGLHNVQADDLALMRLVLRAAINNFDTYSDVFAFVKRHCDATLRPYDGGHHQQGEWSVIIAEDMHGKIACGMYAAFYVQRWRRTVILFYA